MKSTDMLATSSWPVAHASLIDTKAEADFARAQALVEAIRNARGERQVNPKKRIKLLASIKASHVVALAGGVVETLSGVDGVLPLTHARSPTAASMTFEGEECWLDGLVDTAAHMVEHMSPAVAVRQWIVVFPKRVRYFLNIDAGSLNRVAGILRLEV